MVTRTFRKKSGIMTFIEHGKAFQSATLKALWPTIAFVSYLIKILWNLQVLQKPELGQVVILPQLHKLSCGSIVKLVVQKVFQSTLTHWVGQQLLFLKPKILLSESNVFRPHCNGHASAELTDRRSLCTRKMVIIADCERRESFWQRIDQKSYNTP